MLRVSLLTRGAPTQITGGHLYQRRMAEAASRHHACIDVISVRLHRNPFAATCDVVLVDSIAAWAVLPWVLMGRHSRPIAAVLHQPPGGVGQGRLRTRLQAPLDRLLYRRCRSLIAASAALAHALVHEFGLAEERVTVVEPGCDLPPAPRSEGMRAGRRIALLSVGNWVANKGVLELLDAMETLPKGDATLHLAGRDDVDEEYACRVRARLAHPDLVDRVVVHGVVTRDQVAGLYAGADVFVLTSYEETYGTVYGEALAAALPTVGWRSGNLPNLIDDGREGRLIEPGDVAGLAVTLHRLATDDPWREQLQVAAGERGRTLPTWERSAERFFAELRRVAAGHG